MDRALSPSVDFLFTCLRKQQSGYAAEARDALPVSYASEVYTKNDTPLGKLTYDAVSLFQNQSSDSASAKTVALVEVPPTPYTSTTPEDILDVVRHTLEGPMIQGVLFLKGVSHSRSRLLASSGGLPVTPPTLLESRAWVDDLSQRRPDIHVINMTAETAVDDLRRFFGRIISGEVEFLPRIYEVSEKVAGLLSRYRTPLTS